MKPHTNHIGANQYAAQGINLNMLASIVQAAGVVNASSLALPESDAATTELVHNVSAKMLQCEAGERFSVGNFEMLALRFVIEDDDAKHVTILAIENYHSPFPCLVDGHIIDRDDAIAAWLGDTDPEDTPDLDLRYSHQFDL